MIAPRNGALLPLCVVDEGLNLISMSQVADYVLVGSQMCRLHELNGDVPLTPLSSKSGRQLRKARVWEYRDGASLRSECRDSSSSDSLASSSPTRGGSASTTAESVHQPAADAIGTVDRFAGTSREVVPTQSLDHFNTSERVEPWNMLRHSASSQSGAGRHIGSIVNNSPFSIGDAGTERSRSRAGSASHPTRPTTSTYSGTSGTGESYHIPAAYMSSPGGGQAKARSARSHSNVSSIAQSLSEHSDQTDPNFGDGHRSQFTSATYGRVDKPGSSMFSPRLGIDESAVTGGRSSRPSNDSPVEHRRPAQSAFPPSSWHARNEWNPRGHQQAPQNIQACRILGGDPSTGPEPAMDPQPGHSWAAVPQPQDLQGLVPAASDVSAYQVPLEIPPTSQQSAGASTPHGLSPGWPSGPQHSPNVFGPHGGNDYGAQHENESTLRAASDNLSQDFHAADNLTGHAAHGLTPYSREWWRDFLRHEFGTRWPRLRPRSPRNFPSSLARLWRVESPGPD